MIQTTSSTRYCQENMPRKYLAGSDSALFLFVLVLTWSISVQAQGLSKKSAITAKVTEQAIEGQVFVVTKGGNGVRLALLDVRVFNERDFDKQIASTYQEASKLRSQLTQESASLRTERAANTALRHEANLAVELADKDIATANGNESAMKARWARQLAGYKVEEAEKAEKATEAKYSDDTKRTLQPLPPRLFLNELKSPTAQTRSDADGNFQILLTPGAYVLVTSGERLVTREIETYDWMVRVVVNGKSPKLILSNHNLLTTRCVECVELPL